MAEQETEQPTEEAEPETPEYEANDSLLSQVWEAATYPFQWLLGKPRK